MNCHPEVFIPYDVQLRIKELFPTCTEVYKYGPYVCDNIVTLFDNETFLSYYDWEADQTFDL